MITGASFGVIGTAVSVTLGSSTCYNASVTVSHTQITCTATAGTGANLAVVVTVGDLVGTASIFKYQGIRQIYFFMNHSSTNHHLNVISHSWNKLYSNYG